jgi:hypothetical protein
MFILVKITKINYLRIKIFFACGLVGIPCSTQVCLGLVQKVLQFPDRNQSI